MPDAANTTIANFREIYYEALLFTLFVPIAFGTDQLVQLTTPSPPFFLLPGILGCLVGFALYVSPPKRFWTSFALVLELTGITEASLLHNSVSDPYFTFFSIACGPFWTLMAVTILYMKGVSLDRMGYIGKIATAIWKLGKLAYTILEVLFKGLISIVGDSCGIEETDIEAPIEAAVESNTGTRANISPPPYYVSGFPGTPIFTKAVTQSH